MNCIEQKFNLKKHSFTKQYKKERDEQFSQFLFEMEILEINFILII